MDPSSCTRLSDTVFPCGVCPVSSHIWIERVAYEASKGRTLRFLANVDPVDVARNIHDLDPESTLVCQLELVLCLIDVSGLAPAGCHYLENVYNR